MGTIPWDRRYDTHGYRYRSSNTGNRTGSAKTHRQLELRPWDPGIPLGSVLSCIFEEPSRDQESSFFVLQYDRI